MSEFSTAYPNSTKTFVDGPQGVRVPVREIAVENGASSIRVYDTSGPPGHDVKEGLPKLRESWVNARLKPSRSGDRLEPARSICYLRPSQPGRPAPSHRSWSAKAVAER